MKVFQVNGEPSRFYVESSSLECCVCGALFSRLQPKNSHLGVGSECPKCSRQAALGRRGDSGTLDVRMHLVDVAAASPFGKCSCEHYSFNLSPKIAKLSIEEVADLTQHQAAKLRCSHIEAARQAAIDLTLAAHRRECGVGREEAAP